jgi:hypothetical protein
MTWHTELVTRDGFQAALGTIRRAGGTITHSCPCAAGLVITYVMVER